MKKWGILLAALAMVMGLAGCATQHDGLYDDEAALAGPDRVVEVTFTSNTKEPGLMTFSSSSISGADTIWQHRASAGDEVSLEGFLEEKNGGDAKLVLVDPAGVVTTLTEASSDTNEGTFSYTAEQGTYSVKLVGRGEPKVEGQLRFSHGALALD